MEVKAARIQGSRIIFRPTKLIFPGRMEYDGERVIRGFIHAQRRVFCSPRYREFPRNDASPGASLAVIYAASRTGLGGVIVWTSVYECGQWS